MKEDHVSIKRVPPAPREPQANYPTRTRAGHPTKAVLPTPPPPRTRARAAGVSPPEAGACNVVRGEDGVSVAEAGVGRLEPVQNGLASNM
ncbi:hypothetical protein PC128_g20233 [Phytophthora cactorum]|nr:hypothetical protein PC128_g20233 [Phytophthora cactorum]